ncbi:MAG: cytochrome c biogenesis protein CcdA [Trueperaceae bacterium]
MRHPDREPDPGWPRAATPEPAAFLLGLSLAFVVLGYGAGLLGELFFVYDRALRIVAGLLLIVFGLAVANVVRLPFLHRELRVRLTRHPGGAPRVGRRGNGVRRLLDTVRRPRPRWRTGTRR